MLQILLDHLIDHLGYCGSKTLRVPNKIPSPISLYLALKQDSIQFEPYAKLKIDFDWLNTAHHVDANDTQYFLISMVDSSFRPLLVQFVAFYSQDFAKLDLAWFAVFLMVLLSLILQISSIDRQSIQ